MNTAFVTRLREQLSDGARPPAGLMQHDYRIWLETLWITLAVLVAGAVFHRDNVPLHINEGFPWAWLGPLLLALRYGLMPGLASSLIFVVTWELQSSQSGAGFPTEYFFGGGLMVVIAAEFGAGWDARLRRAEETARYLKEHLRRITHRHLLLKRSHDRMEHELLGRPASLRGALIELRKLTTAHSASSMPSADSLLQLLAQYCQLESAAIFVPGSRKHAYVRVAEIGSPPDLAFDDSMLAHALERHALTHLLSDALSTGTNQSPFLVVAPVQASDGTVLGILAVERMPFLALNEENLQLLSVLLAYYADCRMESDSVRQFMGRFPDAPPEVATEFSRMLHLQRGYGINSQVVALSFGSDESGRSALAEHERGMRSLDVTWRIDTIGQTVLVNLMPLADGLAVRSYLARLEGGSQGKPWEARGAFSRAPVVISLAESDPWASLARLI